MPGFNARTWIFRTCIAVIAALIAVSFFSPWWTLNIEAQTWEDVPMPQDPVRVYAYGIRSDLPEAYMADISVPHVTPVYQTIAAGSFLGISLLLMLSSTWLKGKKGMWILAALGLIYVLYPLGTFFIIRNAVTSLGYPVQGYVAVRLSNIITTFTPFYFAVYGLGATLILLAWLRGIIAPGLKADT